jgi:undecaprenyl phosphate N,N'-diacetylbacillosamine 1-phosphate transferase
MGRQPSGLWLCLRRLCEVQRNHGLASSGVVIHIVEDGSHEAPRSQKRVIYRDFIKRFLDVAVAVAALLVVGPVIMIAAAMIRLTSPGPAFFLQKRVGWCGRLFTIYKLRTMHVNEERVLSQTRNDDPEVFAVGRILRRLKIDELPQILNVLKGDMSLIGPRPCMPQTYEAMEDWAKERVKVRPGLTGLAQVSGGVLLSWNDRSRLDVRYVSECSAPLDFRILLKTVAVIVLGEEKFLQAVP